MANVQDVFEGVKLTENGDIAWSTTGERYSDILFGAPYIQKNLKELDKYGINREDALFAMMMRDPRFGFGYRDLGRELLKRASATPEEIAKCGRFDDLIYDFKQTDGKTPNACYIVSQALAGNELAKKWLPRFGSSKKALASHIAKAFNLSKQEYNKLVKANTTERFLTERQTEKINFSQVPSLASIKYSKRFATGKDTSERYLKWKDDVAAGTAKVNTSVTTCYDIYKNVGKEGFDPDLFFDKLEKISLSVLPIIDSSGSMENSFDAFGKALSIGHYLAKCSTYIPGGALSFSSKPAFLNVNKEIKDYDSYWVNTSYLNKWKNSNYGREMSNLYTGDCANTDFKKVMDLMKQVDEFPEYIVVLSDMEFDHGSNQSLKEVEELWKANNCNTKIIWWNFNDRRITTPEKVGAGNIFMSGYSPVLLKFLEAGFDSTKFIDKLLKEYQKKLKTFASQDI